MAEGPRRHQGRLQLVRLAPRQPRDHDARYVRERPHQEQDDPAEGRRFGSRRRHHDPPAERRTAVDLRRGHEVHRGRHPDDDLRGRRIRHRLLARLGRKRHPAAGREGRDRPFVRAHPPFQPRRHGRAAAAVPGRRQRRNPGHHRQRDVRPEGPGRRDPSADAGDPRDPPRRRLDEGNVGPAAHRYADRSGLLQAWRHPAVRAAPAAGRLNPGGCSRGVSRGVRARLMHRAAEGAEPGVAGWALIPVVRRGTISPHRYPAALALSTGVRAPKEKPGSDPSVGSAPPLGSAPSPRAPPPTSYVSAHIRNRLW
ncbi:hypothetical protein Lal_00015022 [Lupinus albus]|nr:hypothetical protein Lal_00014800 [Lupinus albus]KAF1858505.1 hypothetical protein Lal_00015022 [Lupinus albus]